MSTKTAISVCLLLLCAAGCERAKTNQTRTQAPTPAPFSETMFTSVTPTADGGAYAVGFDSGLWYLRGPEAVKVRFPNLAADTADSFFVTLEITPLLDGGAYAHSLLEKSFWYLREGTAVRVKDVPSLSSKPLSSQLNAFPLYIAERKKRLEVEQKLEERPSRDDVQPESDQ